MFKANVALKIVSVALLALLLAACGGGGTAAPTQAPADTGGGGAGAGVSFGVTGQMFTATAPDGFSNTAGALSNGEIAISAAQASLSGVSMEDFVNAAATALGTVESVENNGRTVYYASHAAGITLWVSPDGSNIITLSAARITADPADSLDDLLTIAGTITPQ